MTDRVDPKRLLEITEDLGESDAEVLANARNEDVVAYRSAARILTQAAPAGRGYCPSSEQLARSESDLGAELASRRERHVASCPLCQDDVADLRVLEELRPTLVETLKAKLVLGLRAAREGVAQALELIETSLTPAPAPALAVARGEDQGAAAIVLRVPFGEGELELSWIAARGGADLQARAVGGAPRTYRLALAPQEAGPGLWESRSSDDAGVAALSGLEAGNYVLTAFGPQRRQPDVEVELVLGGESPPE